MIAGVILAGGRASRMGGADKPLLPLDARPILAHVIDRLAPQVDRLALNANGPAERFAAFGLPVLPDRLPPGVEDHPGPLAGILAGLDWAAETGAGVLVTVAGDTPFPPRMLVAVLEATACASGRPLVVAFSIAGDAARPQRHPVFARWPVTLREPLRQALAGGLRRVMDFAEAQGHARAVFTNCDGFRGANTPEELAALERARAG